MRPLESDDPASLGDYRLLGVLGVGGMGRVYLGRNSGGRTVAVKVVRPDLAGDPEFRTRFRREVSAARRVAGRYTVPVLDADVEAPRPWLATGFVAGMALRDAVDDYGPLPENALLALASGLGRALADIHASGLVHRDLKPSNVLLAVDGPRVIDFGIARAADDSALTGTGQVIGSPGYMCPEQITGDAPGPAGDIFSLGAVLVFAATGSGPFGEGDSMSMLWRVVQDPPRLDRVPERLLPVITACLDKDPAARPTPTQLADYVATLGPVGTAGWLPGPVLEDISRRAIMLLDLEAAAPPPEMFGMPPTEQWEVARSAPTMRRPAPTHPHDASRPTAALRPAAPTGPRPTTPRPPGPGYPAAAYQTYDHRPAVPPRRSRRRGMTITVVAVLLIAAGVGAGVLAYHSGGRSTTAAVTTAMTLPASAAVPTSAPPTESTTTTTADPGLILPAGYTGTWSGTATDVVVPFTVTLTVKAGKVGEQIGTSSNTGTVSGGRCDRAETLVSVSDDGVVLRARLIGGSGCNDNGKLTTLRLRSDGGLDYSTPGGFSDMVGVLHKQ